MWTEVQAQGVLEDIKVRLERDHLEFPLQIAGHQIDDEWLYVVVTPSATGMRASDHARIMSSIERDLRDSGSGNVLLVPTIED